MGARCCISVLNWDEGHPWIRRMCEKLRFPVFVRELMTMFEREEEENQSIIDHKNKREDSSPQCKTRTE
jgi:hypothetical protein